MRMRVCLTFAKCDLIPIIRCSVAFCCRCFNALHATEEKNEKEMHKTDRTRFKRLPFYVVSFLLAWLGKIIYRVLKCVTEIC